MMVLPGCNTTAESRQSWLISQSIGMRFLVILGPLLIMFVLPIPLMLIFRKPDEEKSSSKTYWEYFQWIFIAIMGTLILGFLVSLVWKILSAVVMWIIRNWLTIVIVLVSLFVLLALIGAASSENYGSIHARTNSFVVAFIAAIVDTLLILWKMGFLSDFKGGNILLLILTIFILAFLVITTIWALSSDSDGNQKWWFLSALIATIIAGILIPITLEKLFPNARSNIESIALVYFQYCLYGCVVGIIFLPPQVGRAFYKILYNDDVTITHTRKPITQHQYRNAGYRCGRCGQSLPGPVSQCPHCGVRFNSSHDEYLPGTPRPRPIQTTRRNTTPLAGIFLVLLLIADMLYGISLFEIKSSISLSEPTHQLYIGGVLGANLIIIVISAFFVKRYRNINGNIERTTYY